MNLFVFQYCQQEKFLKQNNKYEFQLQFLLSFVTLIVNFGKLPKAVASGASKSAKVKRSMPISSGPGIAILSKSPNKLPMTSCPPILANLKDKMTHQICTYMKMKFLIPMKSESKSYNLPQNKKQNSQKINA